MDAKTYLKRYMSNEVTQKDAVEVLHRNAVSVANIAGALAQQEARVESLLSDLGQARDALTAITEAQDLEDAVSIAYRALDAAAREANA